MDVGLTTFQVEVAQTFFRLDASEGYVVSGGAALVASELIRRPTRDLDLLRRLRSCRSLRARSRSSKRSGVAAGRQCDPRQPDVLSPRRD
jgi:hypothetical protein